METQRDYVLHSSTFYLDIYTLSEACVCFNEGGSFQCVEINHILSLLTKSFDKTLKSNPSNTCQHAFKGFSDS